MDFTIFGNEFFVLSGSTISGVFNHTGLTVWVSQDNVTYYQLAAPYGADDYYPTQGSGNGFLSGQPRALVVQLYRTDDRPGAFALQWFRGRRVFLDFLGGGRWWNSVNLPSISYVGSGRHLGLWIRGCHLPCAGRSRSHPERGSLLRGSGGLLLLSGASVTRQGEADPCGLSALKLPLVLNTYLNQNPDSYLRYKTQSRMEAIGIPVTNRKQLRCCNWIRLSHIPIAGRPVVKGERR